MDWKLYESLLEESEAALWPCEQCESARGRGSAVRTRAEWPLAIDISDEEASELLRGANAGIKPDLCRRAYRAVKRVFDVCASGMAIVVLLVPGIVLSLAICIKSPGASPLYNQLRVGRLRKDGSYCLFRMWKFRSMVPKADEMLRGLKERNEADGPLFKIKDDPRVIPGIGNFIRKHSIDELPKLFNVFLGGGISLRAY